MTRMLLFDVYVGKLRHTITSLICLLCGTFSLRFLGKCVCWQVETYDHQLNLFIMRDLFPPSS